MNFKSLTVLAASALLSTAAVNAQQLKTPAPSPTQKLEQDFALSSIKIEYSRPSAKGRTVYGDVVPFGKVWRTGANGATKITFGDDVKVEGTALKAGTYALYSIPNKDSWEILFYKDLTLGGQVADYKQENEVLRVKVSPAALTSKVETFTINVADITPTTANVELLWEQTRVAFKVSAEIDATIMGNIEKTVVSDNRPYFAAAHYYYENDKDQKKALEWADKAFKANPKAYWIALLKAKIQLKLKDYTGATETANQALALATEGKDGAYITNSEKLIAEAKKGGK